MATDGAEPHDELTPSEIVLLHGQRFATHERDVGAALKLFGVGAAIGVMLVIVLFFRMREGELGSDMLIPLAMLAVSVACWAGGIVMLVKR
jgi:hypothetical protein